MNNTSVAVYQIVSAGEFMVNEFTDGGRRCPSVKVLAKGCFVGNWKSCNLQQSDASQTAITPRVFDVNGVAQSSNIIAEDVVTLMIQSPFCPTKWVC
ncbi:hypothetical protein [Cognatiyoonia sp. IB215182]|uniref:hypothetical protein n=1 Tax=Cognatiyoonia sp. IB215182 TaxID=3097353 RepID=UPI002A1479EF|nr:hypothetical protein [Cognatiyoonia sp. IB215182]MDX8355845.1 hypothetical protein [Cognatiyoonia sp. IB215182]